MLSLHPLYDSRVANHLQTMIEAGWSVTYINWSFMRPLPQLPGMDKVVLDHRDADPVIGFNIFKFVRLLAWFRARAIAARAQLYQIDDLALVPLAPFLPGTVVFDIHENYLNWRGRMRNFARVAYPLCLPFLDGFASTCKANVPRDDKPTAIIPNCQSRKQYDEIAPAQANDAQSVMRVVYFGSLSSVDRDVVVMLDAASICLAASPNICFLFGGPISGPHGTQDLAQLEQLAAQHPDRFQWHGEVSREVVVRITKGADVGLIFLKDASPNRLGGSWNKIYEYLFAGAAILATRGFDIADEVEQSGAGILFDTDVTAQALADQLLQLDRDRSLLKRMKQASSELGTHYSWEKVSHRYIDLYAQLGAAAEK